MSRGPWHVAVLMGGWSAERDVSLMSGGGVADALESRGHKVTRIDMGRDVALRLAETTTSSMVIPFSVISKLSSRDCPFFSVTSWRTGS